MRRYFISIFLFSMVIMPILAQSPVTRNLSFYLDNASRNSPLQRDRLNQSDILNSEKLYLKSVYTHAQTLLSGNYLFVPIINNDNGKTSFDLNAQSANDYYGYDLGVSNGNLQCGITWSKPLLGNAVYKAAESQITVQRDILNNNIKLGLHDIERNVIDQYILCLLDKRQTEYADSVSRLLAVQSNLVSKLVRVGQAKQSDIQLIRIEEKANKESKISYLQSYHSHLMELNALCCISDTANCDIDDYKACVKSPFTNVSQFSAKYELDSLNAVSAQHIYEMKYKPQLNLFANCGVQTTHYSTMYKNFGFSAGLSFSLLLSDGKLRKIKRHEMAAQLASISIYKDNLLRQNEIRCRQCTSSLKDYDHRLQVLKEQISEYNGLLDICYKEICSGQMSVFDYVSTLKNIITAKRQLMTVEANRQLIINAYNYYNW